MNCAECQELLVAYLEGLLEDSQKQAVGRHVNECEACRTELEGLQTLQQRLVSNGKALAHSDLENEVMNRILREQNARLKSAAQAGTGLRLRRLIMKSFTAKIAIGAAVVLAGAAGLYLVGSTKSVVLAEVLNKVEQVPAFMYKMTLHTKGPQQNLPSGAVDIEGTALISNDQGIRLDLNTTMVETGQKMAQQMYLLPRENKFVMVVPDMKQYMRMAVDESMFERVKKQGNDPRLMIRQILETKYTDLGKSVIDGVEVEGFQTTDPAYAGNAFGDVDVKLWVGTKTWLPVRVEMRMKANEQTEMQGTLYDFQWDIPASAADFTPAIGADFTPGPGDGVKMPALTEATALEGLKLFHEFSGAYPENLNLVSLMQAIQNFKDSQTPAAQKFKQEIAQMKPNDESARKIIDTMIPLESLGGFYAMLVQERKDPAYYGKVVKPGDAAQVLLRWKTGENEYRVIFGDLHAATVNADTLARLEAVLPK